MKDIFFYWTGEEPTDTFADVKQYYPSAKFIKYNNNPVATAKDVAKRSLTKQFWLLDIDLIISNSMKNIAVPEWDQSYAHIFSNDILSAYLIPKNYSFTDTELNTGVFDNKKEIVTEEVVYRPYDLFFYYTEYSDAVFNDVRKYFPSAKFVEYTSNIVETARSAGKKSLTKQFWLTDIELLFSKDLLDIKTEDWDKKYVHKFSNGNLNLYFISKDYEYTDEDLESGMFQTKKEFIDADIYYRPYDMFFYWSGKEPTHKFIGIKEIFPNAKFVEFSESVVHTAQQVYKNSLTKQFWLLDIDLLIDKTILDTRVEDWDKQYVHMFSKNKLSAFLISRDYEYTSEDLESGLFVKKKVIETLSVYYRPYELYFYWNGIEPTHKFEGVRRLYPNAKFVKYQKNPVTTAKSIYSKITTDMFWLINIDLMLDSEILNFRAPDWDLKYAHVFASDGLFSYLVPTKYDYDHVETIDGHFSNKKMIEMSGVTYRPYDIFFLSYDEESADVNWEHLHQKYNYAQRIHGVKGIFNAHLKAATESTTDFFWIVDADALVQDTFKFDYRVPSWDFDIVHIWNSRNAVNRLEYGYGGIKLIPKFILLMRADASAVDVTTSIGSKIKLFDEVSNINNFATSPFAAWRAGFREAVKLSSAIISRQNAEESKTRLEVWCHVNVNHPYGEFVKSGAKVGKMFGTKNQHDRDQLALINNYEWLKERFEEFLMIKKLNQQPLETPQQ